MGFGGVIDEGLDIQDNLKFACKVHIQYSNIVNIKNNDKTTK